ncbi:hypothetical protein K3U93_17885 [Mycobacterium malmoense]|uniref:Uncharacterized protein n=1 Tax=Mycobacterium malmoense TaxID=1780 RepID=A0ABX3SPB9_MYCMA|nr:hypothetical protein [Mycobacterium malmoense]ORA80632.1 hypothetical protein BST29_15910 [Mycobacterium malmoense]QZA16525.1 hypothetical protein K3U93_17885 [Mycobacterium malmoense]UNB93325.1 hypothetical protein H5T25_17870 [Mycobacterium malmoense]
MSVGESLLDTFPGRLFIDHLRFFHRHTRVTPTAFVRASRPRDLIVAATHAVSGYLYSDGCANVMDFDTDDPELCEFSAAGLAALSKLSTFDSPQIHQGTVEWLRAPSVRNRDRLCALPFGAFWTSTPIDDDEDSWTLSGENLRRESPRWEVYFDTTHVRVTRIDSARDWRDLVESNPVTADGCKYPDWPAIAASWDAVHLSATGLLLAHPTISTTPFVTTDGSGRAHSRAGPVASVADWSVVSTAWLHPPPDVELRPAAGARSY